MQVMAIVFLGVILSMKGYIDNDKQKVRIHVHYLIFIDINHKLHCTHSGYRS